MNDWPQEISGEEVAPLLAEGAIQLIDCREEDEWAICRIDGSILIPMDSVPDRLEEISREIPVVVHCHHGMRSARVCNYLRQRGYGKVANLRGGIDAWSREVDPSVRRY
ncbi:MAG: rhodanese-like domain-containing protein [Puniceicoccaceae bacterium]